MFKKVDMVDIRQLSGAHRGPCIILLLRGTPFCVHRYSMEARAIEHQCSCCQETKVHDVAATLQCPDGTVIQHTYTHIDECKCAPACSSLPMTSMTIS